MQDSLRCCKSSILATSRLGTRTARTDEKNHLLLRTFAESLGRGDGQGRNHSLWILPRALHSAKSGGQGRNRTFVDFASCFALSEIWWPRAESPSVDFASRFALGEIWWPRAESNHRHTDFQSAALPTELLGHFLERAITILMQKQVKPTACT